MPDRLSRNRGSRTLRDLAYGMAYMGLGFVLVPIALSAFNRSVAEGTLIAAMASIIVVIGLTRVLFGQQWAAIVLSVILVLVLLFAGLAISFYDRYDALFAIFVGGAIFLSLFFALAARYLISSKGVQRGGSSS